MQDAIMQYLIEPRWVGRGPTGVWLESSWCLAGVWRESCCNWADADLEGGLVGVWRASGRGPACIWLRFGCAWSG